MKIYYRHKLSNEYELIKEINSSKEIYDFIGHKMDDGKMYEFVFGDKKFIIMKYLELRNTFKFVIVGRKVYNLNYKTLYNLLNYYNRRNPIS